MACSTPFPAVAALCEPCPCDRCDGAEKLRGELCESCGEAQWGCRNMLCPCELSGWVPREVRMDAEGNRVWVPRLCPCGARIGLALDICTECWFAERRKEDRGASALQALWRGHKARKQLKERNAEEVRAATPLWRTYDEEYKMNAICQTIEAELKKDDPSWDATKTPYYIWMQENSRFLDTCETYLRRRGWVRPRKTRFRHPTLFLNMVKGVLRSNNVSAAEEGLFMAQMDALLHNH